MWPLPGCSCQKHMGFLDVDARIVVLTGQVQTNQGEGDRDRFDVCACMLCGIRINGKLVRKRFIAQRQGVGSEFVVDLPTRGGGMIALIETFVC